MSSRDDDNLDFDFFDDETREGEGSARPLRRHDPQAAEAAAEAAGRVGRSSKRRRASRRSCV